MYPVLVTPGSPAGVEGPEAVSAASRARGRAAPGRAQPRRERDRAPSTPRTLGRGLLPA